MIIGGVLYFIFVSIYGLINKDHILKEITNLTYDQKKIFLIISFVGFIASLLYYYALSKENSSKVVIITSIWPIFALLFGSLLLNEKLNPKLLIAAIAIMILVSYIEN
jgi:drug/metabolite transporter (DMT)-like permease